MLKVKQLQVPQHYHKGPKVQNQSSEADPVFVASPAYSINSSDLADIKNLSGTNTGDQDLSDYVKGPASSVANQEVLFDGVTGKLIKGGSLGIYKAPCSDIDVASTSFVDLISTSAVLAAGDTIYIQALIWLYNGSGTARQYEWAIDIGGTAAYVDSRGTVPSCAAGEGLFIPVEFWISVASDALTWIVGRMNYGVAVALATTQTGLQNNGVETTKIVADMTGSKTIKIQMKSVSATATQTATLLSWQLEKRVDRG